MTAVSTFHILWKGIKKVPERGPTLVVLFLFLGVTSYLGWDAAAAYGVTAQAAVAITAGVLVTAACLITTNTLVDSGTKIELSSMYLTDYRGIAWTTATMLLGTLLFDVIMLLCAALFLLPFIIGDGVVLLDQLLTAPQALQLSQLYVLFVQLQSLLLTIYVGTRLMVYPVVIAVESTSFFKAMKHSAAMTQGHVLRLAPVLLVAAAAVPAVLVAGVRTGAMVLTELTRFGTVPYMEQIVVGSVYGLFLGIGAVFILALTATAYSALK